MLHLFHRYENSLKVRVCVLLSIVSLVSRTMSAWHKEVFHRVLEKQCRVVVKHGALVSGHPGLGSRSAVDQPCAFGHCFCTPSLHLWGGFAYVEQLEQCPSREALDPSCLLFLLASLYGRMRLRLHMKSFMNGRLRRPRTHCGTLGR